MGFVPSRVRVPPKGMLFSVLNYALPFKALEGDMWALFNSSTVGFIYLTGIVGDDKL